MSCPYEHRLVLLVNKLAQKTAVQLVCSQKKKKRQKNMDNVTLIKRAKV